MQIFSIIKHIYIVFTIASYMISNFSGYLLLLSKSEKHHVFSKILHVRSDV